MLRNALKFFAAAAVLTLFAAGARAGEWGTGCGCSYGHAYGYAGYYGHYGYGYPYPHLHAAYYAPQPPRYFVDQGPAYTGPNVTHFPPGAYNSGYVETRAYPYVTGYFGSVYRPRYIARRHHWHAIRVRG